MNEQIKMLLSAMFKWNWNVEMMFLDQFLNVQMCGNMIQLFFFKFNDT